MTILQNFGEIGHNDRQLLSSKSAGQREKIDPGLQRSSPRNLEKKNNDETSSQSTGDTVPVGPFLPEGIDKKGFKSSAL